MKVLPGTNVPVRTETKISKGFVTREAIVVRSTDVARIEKASREITSLLEQGVSVTSDAPKYFYTRLGELKVEMLAAAGKDARARAENILALRGRRRHRQADRRRHGHHQHQPRQLDRRPPRRATTTPRRSRRTSSPSSTPSSRSTSSLRTPRGSSSRSDRSRRGRARRARRRRAAASCARSFSTRSWARRPAGAQLEHVLATILVAALAAHQAALDQRLERAPGERRVGAGRARQLGLRDAAVPADVPQELGLRAAHLHVGVGLRGDRGEAPLEGAERLDELGGVASPGHVSYLLDGAARAQRTRCPIDKIDPSTIFSGRVYE